MQSRPRQFTRRRFVVESAAAAVSAVAVTKFADHFATAAEAAPTHQATGVKAGEVTDTSAIVWARLTESPARNVNGVDLRGRVDKKARKQVDVPVAQLEGACPGAPGGVRVRCGPSEDWSDAKATEWAEVSAGTVFTPQFALNGLKPATTYH